MLTEDEMTALKVALLARLAEIDELDRTTGDSRKPVELDQQSVGRLSRMDAMQMQAMALAAGERRAQERRRVLAALHRFDAGEYGYCIRCGEEIAAARLRLDPTVPQCLPCAKGGEQ
ncbi:MAG: TraR/DksA C4-type zinc finger protein [Rhodothalassiaceae bacterium]